MAGSPLKLADAGAPEAGDSQLYQLLLSALPNDLTLAELESGSGSGLWQKDRTAALKSAIKDCPRIDWRAYGERYPEVKASGLEPFAHFIEHGLYEGKTLISKHPLKGAHTGPAISVCLINHNNAAYIETCIESVLNQTLDNIEIIIVDDASTDASPAIIKEYAAKDGRIKPVFKTENGGSFAARMSALNNSGGEYIIFLDSDDYLAPEACEKAYQQIIKGYDIVEFCFEVNNAGGVEQARIERCQNYADCEEACEYDQASLIGNIFITRALRWNLCGKIISREICKAAFADLQRDYNINAEDLYAMIAIARFTRSLLKIPDRLYVYNFGIGYSSGRPSPATLARWFTLGETVAKAGAYAAKHGLDIGFERIKKEMAGVSIQRWLDAVPPEAAAEYWELLKRQYGFDFLLTTLISEFRRKIVPLARQFQNCVDFSPKTIIRRVGLYYQRLNPGGVQSVLASMAQALSEQDYEIILFIEEKHQNQISLPDRVKIVYLNCGPNDPARRARILDASLKTNKIDLMLYASMGDPGLFWNLLVLHENQIPLIVNHHGDFSLAYATDRHAGFSPHEQNAVYACAQAVTCLSKASEAWFRLAGINAWRLPNAIRPANPGPLPEMRENIAILGRLGDPVKQIGQSLLVLSEVIKKRPGCRLYLIGDFTTENQKAEFYDEIRRLGLGKNVFLTGWTNEPDRYLNECGVLLSTSYWESFGLALGEAQALGLPCVSYDAPIEQAEANPALLTVKQGNYKAAANEIVNLFEDKARWKELSKEARQAARRYSPDYLAANLKKLIADFASLSPWQPPDPALFRQIIRYASFYSGRPWPAKWC